jgi:hypothetical protein
VPFYQAEIMNETVLHKAIKTYNISTTNYKRATLILYQSMTQHYIHMRLATLQASISII